MSDAATVTDTDQQAPEVLTPPDWAEAEETELGRWAVYDTRLLRFTSPVTEDEQTAAEWADEDPERHEVRCV